MNNKKKILIVEDNKQDQVLILDYLKDEDYQLLAENNGADALGVIERENPDLVLLDLVIPEVDGIQMCNKLNAAYRGWKPKIIIITKVTPILDKMKKDWFIETLADELITKPVDKYDLLQKVRSLLS